MANITIFNNLNATLYIPSYAQGGDALLNIVGPENFTGVANLTINNNQIDNIQIINGQASLNLNLGLGQYTATITTPDTVYYMDADRNLTCIYLAANTTSNQFIVKRVNVIIDAPNITYGENQIINVNINATGNITIRLNGKNIINYTNVAYDKIDYPIGYLTAGNYTVEVIYRGNDFIAPNSNSTNFTVYKSNSSFDGVNNLIMDYRDGSAWAVTLTDARGNAISNAVVKIGIKINGVDKVYNRRTDANGIARLPINLVSGEYAVNATFNGNGNYFGSFASATVTVNPAATILSGNNLEMSYRDGSAWAVTLTDARGNAISNAVVKIGIKINGVDKVYNRRTDANGVARLPINIAPGEYAVNATFEGNTKYSAAFANATITVNKKALTISAEDLTMSYKDGSAYKVKVVDADGNAVANIKVKVTLRNKVYTIKTDSNGTAQLPIGLSLGNYVVTATVNEANYESNTITNTIKVTTDSLAITADDVSMTYKDGTAYKVQLVDRQGNPMALANQIVKITVKGKTYGIKTDAKGIAKLPINLAAGTYVIKAEYSGIEITNNVTVVKP